MFLIVRLNGLQLKFKYSGILHSLGLVKLRAFRPFLENHRIPWFNLTPGFSSRLWVYGIDAAISDASRTNACLNRFVFRG